MTTVFLAPDPIQSTQFIPGGNTPAAGAQLFCYAAGSSTKQNMYTDNTGTPTWSNPLVLDSGGNIPNGGEIWIPQSLPAKFVLAPSNDTDPPNSPYWTKDNISGVNDVATTTSGEWTLFSETPSFTGQTTFTVTGDQTAVFSKGIRVKSVNSGGTVYSTVTNSSFSGVTTVTVINDSGVLDSGLTTVSYSNLSTPNGSIPWTQVQTAGLNFSTASITTGPLTVNSTATFFRPIDISATNAGQVIFGVLNASANRQTLDYYDENPYQPSLLFQGASSGIGYTQRIGGYVRVGALVTMYAALNTSTLGISSGAPAEVTLPFPLSSSGNLGVTQAVGSVGWLQMSSSVNGSMFIRGVSGSTATLWGTTTGVVGSPIQFGSAQFTASSQIYISMSYLTNT